MLQIVSQFLGSWLPGLMYLATSIWIQKKPTMWGPPVMFVGL
jgi:hypothetical protein